MPENVKVLDQELNQLILSGQIMPAFEKFYAEDAVMQENTDAPKVGKAVNRKAEEAFVASVEQFHGATVLGSVVEGDRSYSEWDLDITYKGGGRVKQTQVPAPYSFNFRSFDSRYFGPIPTNMIRHRLAHAMWLPFRLRQDGVSLLSTVAFEWQN